MNLTDDEHQNRLLANFARNDPVKFRRYLLLPEYSPGMTVRCATHNPDGTTIDEDDIPGCGSDVVDYDGDVYDCLACGIFFSDYAADPPHRRRQHSDGTPVVWDYAAIVKAVL